LRRVGPPPARLTAEAIAALRAYDWPGNVRELRNVIRRALVWAEDTITPHHLDLPTTSPPAATASPDPYPALACGRGSPSTNSRSPSPPDSLGSLPLPLDGQVPLRELVRRHAEQIERLLVEQALRQSGGNKAKAARLLQVDYKTIRTKAKEYQISHTKEDDRE
jgi:DNA-binding NtrC family response regulator